MLEFTTHMSASCSAVRLHKLKADSSSTDDCSANQSKQHQLSRFVAFWTQLRISEVLDWVVGPDALIALGPDRMVILKTGIASEQRVC